MKKIIFIILHFHIIFLCYAQNTIEGVWSAHTFPELDIMVTQSFKLPRGELTVPNAFDIIIDLNNEKPSIIVNQHNWDDIISIDVSSNVTELTFYFRRGEAFVTLFFHFNEDGTMWIEDLPVGRSFLGTGIGKDFIYYKMGNISETGEFELNLEYAEMARKNNDILARYNNWSRIKEKLLQDKEEPLNNGEKIINTDIDITTLETENIAKTNIFKAWYLFFLIIPLIIFLGIIIYIKRKDCSARI